MPGQIVIGSRFGKWCVVDIGALIEVECDCGTVRTLTRGALKSGLTRQCTVCARNERKQFKFGSSEERKLRHPEEDAKDKAMVDAWLKDNKVTKC
jgi:hypothetical protein